MDKFASTMQTGWGASERTGRPKGKGWEKEGKEWVNPRTKERVYPDLDHPVHGPHVDYKDGKGRRWRVYPDGRIELK